jgi:hypothetical protein
MSTKKLCVAALAVSISLPAIAPVSVAAGEMQATPSAPIVLAGYKDGWKGGYKGSKEYRRGWRRDNDGWWFPLAAFGLGAVIGSTVAQPRAVIVEGGNAHVDWCYSRYRSYRAWDNTYQPFNGPRRECFSPYG